MWASSKILIKKLYFSANTLNKTSYCRTVPVRVAWDRYERRVPSMAIHGQYTLEARPYRGGRASSFAICHKMLGRARLQEYFQRVLREDMLTLFNCTAELKSLECSIVLHGAQSMSDETKYRAASTLELLTGQRVMGKECDAMQEDPLQRTATEAQKRELERTRGALIQQSLRGAAAKKKGSTANARPTSSASLSQQIRKMGSGIKLVSTLHGVKMYYFLEKAREFYLPDTVEEAEVSLARKSWRPAAQGHDNSLEKRGIVMQFEKAGGSKRDCYPARYPVRRDENPKEATSCYTLRSTDLLKFPDIEMHFEALGSVLGGARADGQPLQLIIRPTLKMHSPLSEEGRRMVPPVENLRVMNYLLSQYFNAYINRPACGTFE